MAARRFAYLPLPAISARLGELLTLKPIIGLRSPFHTVAKALNPFDAPCQMIGVAHPPYRPLHQKAAAMLGHVLVTKQTGGSWYRAPFLVTDNANIPYEPFTEMQVDAPSTLQWLFHGAFAERDDF